MSWGVSVGVGRWDVVGGVDGLSLKMIKTVNKRVIISPMGISLFFVMFGFMIKFSKKTRADWLVLNQINVKLVKEVLKL